MPTITQLEYILALHQTGHFGRAAALANVSQPTLSTQIQRAEAELGVTIFDRHTHPIAATPVGLELIEHAQVVVAAHENLLRRAARKFAAPAGEFALGIIPTLAPYVLPWFLRRFADEHRAVELRIHERPTDALLLELAHHRLDAAILATPLGEPSLEERVLFYDPFYLYAHPDEPLLRTPEVALEGLDPRKLWLLEDGHCFRTQVLAVCAIHEREHLGSVHFAAGSFETLRHLIDASEGYTLIPETYARTLATATRRRCVRAFVSDTARGIPTREVSLVHSRRSWKGDILDALERILAATVPRVFPRTPDDAELVLLAPTSAPTGPRVTR